MSLGHTEPITQKHTLQKHPTEESSGLDLKDFRFQEVLQTAGDFNKHWLQGKQWDHLWPQVYPQVDVRNMVKRAQALEANSTGAPPLHPSPGTSGFLLQMPTTFCLKLSWATRAFPAH